VFAVTKDKLNPAPLDHVPLAGVKRRLELIEADRGRRPVTVAIPREPASAMDPRAEPVQGG
jgi:hypothetical protein